MTCESDLEVDTTSDLIVRSRLAPRDAVKREQHRRLVRSDVEASARAWAHMAFAGIRTGIPQQPIVDAAVAGSRVYGVRRDELSELAG